ncbi:MAG: S9 family peptidase, partial [Chitinophagaceae bacterium]|nr:S9 family peptidase [Chitinophagaceae bacterium]
GTGKPLAIADYIWSEGITANSWVLPIPKCGDKIRRRIMWVLNTANGKLTQLGKGTEEATLMFAKFSPRCRQGGLCRQTQYLCGRDQQRYNNKAYKDGGDNIINGTLDWVYGRSSAT